jgi:hypothetical protein
MQLVQILLPRTDNSGHPFGREEYDHVKEDLARRFDGVIAYLQSPAEGLWRQGAETANDQFVIFEVMVEEVDREYWRTRQIRLEEMFRQDKIVIRCLPMELV